MAVWVIGCLSKRMFLEQSVLAFGWMCIWMEAGEAGCVETVIDPGADLVNLIPQLRQSALGKQGQPGRRFLVVVVY